ncbi:MAG: MFS transporter [Pseudomonadota bacterium]
MTTDASTKSTSPQSPTGAQQAATSANDSPFRQWHLVVVVTLTYVVGNIDRAAINLVVEPIKHDLQISDVQMSLLLGLAFVVLYSVSIVPAGYIADRVSRRLLLAGAVVFWSAAAVVSGFARSYGQLFAARASLGLGESALPPAAYSLLRDGVAEKNRGRAFSMYQSGITFGNGLGALAGGAIFGLATQGFFSSMPFFGHLRPWQLVIVLPGLCGILVAALLLTVREPARAKIPAAGDPATFGEMFRYLRQNASVYAAIFAGVITISLGTSGWSAWIAAALGRTWGLSPATIGTTVGTMSLILFPLSAFVSGSLMDYIKRRWQNPAAPFWVAVGGCILNLGPAMYVLHAPSIASMWIAYGLFIFCSTWAVQAACGYMLATVTPGRLMGKVTSFYYLINNMLGGVFGPMIVALIAQYGFTGSRGLASAMTISYSLFVSCAVVVLLIGVRQIHRWHAKTANVANA